MMDTMDPDRTRTIAEALDLLPKVELHCHIEGTMVAIALAGVDAAWLTGTQKAALRSRISTAALELASSIGLPSAGGLLG